MTRTMTQGGNDMATQTLPRTPRQAPGTPVPRTRTRPVTSPWHTRPVAKPGPPRPRSPRMAFIVLLVGLLVGAMVSLIVISTTLAAGSFRIDSLKKQNASLAQQQQTLANQVAQESSQAEIAREARQLGMRQNPYLRFIDLKTGKIVTGKVSKSDAAINVPGFTP
jgi:hypothetical protein